ncbi:8686_t:CDS:2, partial [Funneliformis mosseae]
ANFLILNPDSDSKNEMQKLEGLIDYLPENDHFTIDDYIHIDNKFEGGITDKEILKIIINKKDELIDIFVNETDETIKEVK